MPDASRESKRQTWTERLERFKTTDQTVAQFCAAEGVSVPSFYQWRRKLNRQSQTLAETQPSFLPLEFSSGRDHPSPQSEPETALSLDLPGGVSVRLEVRGTGRAT